MERSNCCGAGQPGRDCHDSEFTAVSQQGRRPPCSLSAGGTASSRDHLVGAADQRQRNGEAERLYPLGLRETEFLPGVATLPLR